MELFKAQLFALTGVPPERQKIMGVKGGTLKDDADLSALGIKAGQNLMLMGSAEKAPEAPKEATVFAEDMPAVDVAALATDNPGGLSNLGNTCYLNSSLQCMKAIPELTSALQVYTSQGGPRDGTVSIVPQMRSIMTDLQGSNAAREVNPFGFVSAFRAAFPMFAERTENGQGYVQQDAEECWSTLVSNLSQHMQLPTEGGGEAATSNLAAADGGQVLPRQKALKRNLGDMLFGLEFESTYKCLDNDSEPSYVMRDTERKIACHISEKTAHLYTALEVNLDELIDKHSEQLGREAQYSKKRKIARLPPILTVQFVRFAWRKDTGKRAKILRTVSFPPVLDVRNLCTANLQASINAHCSALEEERDAAAGVSAAAPAPSSAEGSSSGEAAMDIADPEPAKSPEELAELAKGAAGAECGDNRTGRYELFAVITHQGRTAEGGHYVAWVKKDAKKWLVFDDETVAEIDAERVKELYGGGDWHMAYMCFYRKMDGLTLD